MSSSEENTTENHDPSSSGSHDHEGMIDEIRDLTAQTRLWRIGSIVVVLLIFSVFIWSMLNHVRGEFPKTKEERITFLKNLHEDAKAGVIPSANKLLKDTSNDLVKLLEPKGRELAAKVMKDSREEVSLQLRLLWENKGGEVLGIAAEELDTLVRGVPYNAIDAYNKTLNEVLSEKMAGLKLPTGGSGQLASGRLAAAVKEGLIAASTNRTGDIIAVMFEPHIMELSAMSNHLNAIYDKEYGAMESRERKFTMSMALTLMERVNIQLREAEESLKAQHEANQIKEKENEQKGKSNKKK